MQTIITKPEGAFFKAFPEGSPTIFGERITREIALSDLIEKYPEIFAIVISPQ